MKKKNLIIFILCLIIFSFISTKFSRYAQAACTVCPDGYGLWNGTCCEDISCEETITPTYESCTGDQTCVEGEGCREQEPEQEQCGEHNYPYNNCCVDSNANRFCHGILEIDFQGALCLCITPEEKCTKSGKVWSEEAGCKDEWYQLELGEDCPDGWEKVERGGSNGLPLTYFCDYVGGSGSGVPTIQPTMCGDGDTGIQTAIGCIPTEPGAFVTKFINWAIGIAGGVAFLLMLFSAFGILTSAGDPEKLKASQERLTSAIIGLLFIIFSVFLLRIIGTPIMELGGVN